MHFSRYLYVFALGLAMASCTYKPVRLVQDFNKDWEFRLTTDDSAGTEWRKLDLPHDWSIEGPFHKDHPASPGGGALPGGKACYKKLFTIDHSVTGKCVFLEFDGVFMNSDVYVNGHHAGSRPYGYSSFSYDITSFLNPAGEPNLVLVRVDNSMQPNSRWYTGSGIYRNVRLVETSASHIPYCGTYITTPSVTDKKAEIRVQTSVYGGSPEKEKIYLLTKIKDPSGRVVAEECKQIAFDSAGIQEVVQDLSVRNPERWDVDNPGLYTAVSLLLKGSRVVDDYKTTFGIRTIRFTADSGFFLNDRPLKLKGVCQHHDLGALGAAVNTRALERQLEILRRMGCNAIRTSHNPPAPQLLDLCDRLGFLVMDEAFDVWRKRKTTYDYSIYFSDWYEKDLRDFIIRDRNHPSVIMWSIGNEVQEQWNRPEADTLDVRQANLLLNFKDKEVQDISEEMPFDALLTQKLAEIVRELDPGRPVTAGCNEPAPYNNLFRSKALDIIGYNYHEGNYSSIPENYPGMPFVAAETTSSLQTRGFYMMPSDSVRKEPREWWLTYETPHLSCSAYDNMHTPWGNTHEGAWTMVRDSDFISGLFVWTGFDYLGEPTPYWWPARSSYFGIIDLAGFPKDVYYMYQSEWTDETVLHVFPHWNWSPGDTTDVWAYYSKADSVELFLNDRSLGSSAKNKNRLHAFWRVPFEPGTLLAVSYKDGQEIMRREVHTAGAPAGLRLTADRDHLNADGYDLSFITVQVTDKEGNEVPHAQNTIRFEVEGPARIVGVDNGSPISHEPFKADYRKAFNGKCLVILQSTESPGTVKLTAVLDSLPERFTLSLKTGLVE